MQWDDISPDLLAFARQPVIELANDETIPLPERMLARRRELAALKAQAPLGRRSVLPTLDADTMPAPSPLITYMQYCIFTILQGEDLTVADIRVRLRANYNERKSIITLVATMQSLQETGLVIDRQESVRISGRTITRRWYRLTDDGHAALQETMIFVARFSQPRLAWGY